MVRVTHTCSSAVEQLEFQFEHTRTHHIAADLTDLNGSVCGCVCAPVIAREKCTRGTIRIEL